MSKSYVTQFTEYMADQRDKFESALINKGFPVDKNASIGNMVSLFSANTEMKYGVLVIANAI